MDQPEPKKDTDLSETTSYFTAIFNALSKLYSSFTDDTSRASITSSEDGTNKNAEVSAGDDSTNPLEQPQLESEDDEVASRPSSTSGESSISRQSEDSDNYSRSNIATTSAHNTQPLSDDTTRSSIASQGLNADRVSSISSLTNDNGIDINEYQSSNSITSENDDSPQPQEKQQTEPKKTLMCLMKNFFTRNTSKKIDDTDVSIQISAGPKVKSSESYTNFINDLEKSGLFIKADHVSAANHFDDTSKKFVYQSNPDQQTVAFDDLSCHFSQKGKFSLKCSSGQLDFLKETPLPDRSSNNSNNPPAELRLDQLPAAKATFFQKALQSIPNPQVHIAKGCPNTDELKKLAEIVMNLVEKQGISHKSIKIDENRIDPSLKDSALFKEMKKFLETGIDNGKTLKDEINKMNTNTNSISPKPK